jgi:alkylation response protein AidB-like acyl-CoA dehydrogenase
MAYSIDKRDILFTLFEWIDIDRILALDPYRGFTREDARMLIDASEKLAKEVLDPINASGDKEGCRFENGKVYTPKGYKEAWRRYAEQGWIGAAGSPEYGGQGIPGSVGIACGEIAVGACTAFTMYPGLTGATAHLLEEEASEEVRNLYVEKMYSGQWAGVMVLTEPQAGSAVGDIKTRAKKQGDTYLLNGTKIFISGGEQDLTENIVHVLLARTEGAPPGIKGLSLFVAPKYLVNPDGSLGPFNNITCSGIEHKMGIRGSATCTIHYGDEGPCRAHLIGQECQGINIMFKLMNHARIGCGLQGLAQGASAHQYSLKYAAERIQGTRLEDFRDPAAPRVAIIEHPDVRRMLMIQKSLVEGIRAILYTAAYLLDLSRGSAHEEERERAQDLVELFTPIAKAYSTDFGFECCRLAVQIYGGYGFSEEYPVAQLLRDSKIASIYEGTNGIQALDLLGRKVSYKGGRLFMRFIEELNRFVADSKGHPWLESRAGRLEAARDILVKTTMHLGQAGMGGDIKYPALYATPYLEMFGHVLAAFLLLQQARVAHDKLKVLFDENNCNSSESQAKLCQSNYDAKFYKAKLATTDFFLTNILPAIEGLEETILSGDRSALEIGFELESA